MVLLPDERGVYAERIKELRVRNHMTQNQFAAKLDVSESTVRMWELGKSRAQNPTLARIMELFGVSLDWLYGNAGTAQSPGEAAPQELPDKPFALPRPARALGESATLPPFGRDYLPVLAAAAKGPIDWRQCGATGWAPAPEDLLKGDIHCFYYVRVSDEAMYPVMLPGDLAFIRCQDRVGNGEVAAAQIDGGTPRLVRVRRADPQQDAPEWIELVWDNPHFPPRRFEGDDARRVHVLGRVMRVTRDL